MYEGLNMLTAIT